MFGVQPEAIYQRYKVIARRAGLKPRMVRYALASLEAKGLVQLVRRGRLNEAEDFLTAMIDDGVEPLRAHLARADVRRRRDAAACTAALAALTAAPAAIRVERVEVQLRRAPTSGYAVAVSYTNLRTADRRARTVTV